VDLGLSKALDNGYHEDPLGANTVVEDDLINIQKVIGTGANDTIYGNSYANVLIGGAGNDTLDGREGDDTLYGIADDNKLYGGDNNDTVYGGTGNDTLDGGAGDDILDGRARDINGNLVNTTDGDNTYIGGTGNDTLWGGNGIDTLYYASSESGITVTLKPDGEDSTIVSSTDGTDTLKTHFERIIATNYKDEIDLSDARGDNTVLAYGGNDTLTASVNYDDLIYGGDGNDLIYANGGDNTYYGGNATVDGNGNITGATASGTDTISYINASNSVNVDLSANEASDNGFGGADALYDIANVTGSNHNDVLKGDNSINVIRAQEGDDWIIATLGNDAIYGGNHTVVGNTQGSGLAIEGGGDWLSFAGINNGLDATMSANAITFGGYTPNIVEIENLFGTNHADTLRGDSSNNTLHGNQDNDVIYGTAGSNFLIGGQGNDTLHGGTGVDQYDGGDFEIVTADGTNYYTGSATHGNNTISFYYATNSVNIDLSYDNGDGTTGRVNDDGYGNVETYIRNIHNITGTLNYNDTLKGNSNSNIISGLGGHDEIQGIGGENTLYGGTGNDTIYTASSKIGAQRGDVAFGGQGIDTFVGSFNDAFLIGGDEAFEDLEGDWIDYGSLTLGANPYGISVNLEQVTMFTDADGDRAYLNGDYSQVFRLDSNGDIIANEFDYIMQIEHIQGSNATDLLMGKHGENNSIMAGDGDDTIFLSSGINHIDGEGYTDIGNWLSLENMSGTISNFDLANNNAGDSKVYNIQNVIDFDGNRNQTVWGSNSDNIFVMYAGNDHVLSRNGNNIIDLGDGNDTASINYGSDTIIGGSGQDSIDLVNNLGANQSSIIILNDIAAADFNTLATGFSSLSLSNQNSTIVSIDLGDINGLSLTGSHNFYSITDGRGQTDYLYQEGANPDIEIFRLTHYADVLVGSNNNDTIYGNNGADTLWGMQGDDSIYGGAGNDIIFGVQGNNRLEGDSGNDLIFGGTGNDVIRGDDGNDTLYGKVGNNNIDGGANDDIIYAGTGTDIIDGGADNDTLRFDGGTQRVVVNLGSDALSYDATTINANRFINSWLNGGSEQTGTVTDIENIDGTQYNDTMRGNSERNIIKTGEGDDYIFASLGNDEIHGDGNTSGHGDWVNFSLITTVDGVNVDILTQDNANFRHDNAGTITDYNQTLFGIENIIGTAQDDHIKGSDGATNTLMGGAGADEIYGVGGENQLYGDAGNDTIYSGTGNDYINGGANNNTVDYTDRHNASNVRVNLSNSSQTHNSGTATATMTGATSGMTDTLVDIHNVNTGGGYDTVWGSNGTNIINTGAGNDVIYGMGGENTIYAGSAADTIYGGSGVDSIYGEDGNDIIIASAGADIIDGGADLDVVDYSSSSTGITVTLLDNGATTNVNHNITGAYTDTLTNIEGIIGSLTQANNLTGNNMNNSLVGGNQTDIIKGVSGDNYLNGGVGADTIYAGTGNDSIIGGSLDENWLYYTEVGGADVNVNLRSEIATYGTSSDTIIQIKHLQMGNGTNSVEGNAYANSFIGGSAEDTLSYSGAAGSITLNVTANGEGTSSGDGNDVFENFEHYILSNNADTIHLDVVHDGSIINGGANSDTADYTNVATALTVTVNNGNTSATVTNGGHTNTLQNIEKIIGGVGDDIFTVSDVTGIETLDGSGGTNTLNLSGNLDLSSVTLLNFDEIAVANGETLTLNAKELSDKTMTITLNGTGSLVIISDSSSHDFSNITINKTGTANGVVTLDVNINKDISGTDINGIVDIFDVNASNTLTLSYSQFDGNEGSGAGTLKLSDTTLTGAQIKSINDNSTNAIDLSSVTTVSTATISEMLEVVENTGANFTTAPNYTVNISDTASASDINKVLADTTGVVTADVSADTAENLNTQLTQATAIDALTLTVSNDTGATQATDLTNLDAKTSQTIDATAVTSVIGTGTQVAAIASADITMKADYTATLIGTSAASDINIVASDTTGAVTASATGTADSLNTALNDASLTGNDALTLTITGATAQATDLNALDGKTSEDIIVDASKVTGTYAQIETVYITNANNFANLGNEQVEISGTITATQADTIADLTSGIVTATLNQGTATDLNNSLNDSGGQVNAYTITVNGGTAVASDLVALASKTSVAINADTHISTLTGSAADIKTVLESNEINTSANVNITITGTTPATLEELKAINDDTSGDITLNAQSISQNYSGSVSLIKDAFAGTITEHNGTIELTDSSVSANDLNFAAQKTTGALTATIATGAVSATLSAITDVNASDVITFTTNESSVDASDLVDLNVKIDNFTTTSINTITEAYDTASLTTEINDALAIVSNANVTITGGSISATDANTMANATNGVVTAIITADTASNLNTHLASATSSDALSVTITATDTAASDLNALVNKTSEAINAQAITKLTGDANAIKTALASSNITTVSNNSLATEVSGTVSIADANTIYNDSATGVVTAIIETQSASQLATLAGSGNAYTITVSATDSTASDLLSIKDKTTIEVDANNVTKITGTAAELETLRTAITNDELNIASNVSIDVTGTTLDAQDLNDINDMTTGTVTVTEMTEIEGTVSQINTLYQNDAGFNDLTGMDVTLTQAGSFTQSDFNQISNGDIATLNFAHGDDSISFTDQTSFDTWASKFNDIDFGSSSDDSVSFNNAVNGELDFSNITELENVNLSGDSDNVTLTPNSGNSDTVFVDGGASDDSFTLDFSNISRFEIDGGTGTDGVILSGNNHAMNDADFSQLSNIETLNFSGDSNTINLDAQTINAWLSGSGSTEFTISGSSDDTLNILTNNTDYKWSTDESNWSTDNISGATTDTYYISTDGNDTTDFTLTIAAV
jgi:Ca2+-binding RTX toxin-like protein